MRGMLSHRRRLIRLTPCPEIPIRTNQEFIYSDLQTTYAMDGHTLEIKTIAYQTANGFLRFLMNSKKSTVWEDAIATDEAALAETIGEMKSEGVHAFIGPHSA